MMAGVRVSRELPHSARVRGSRCPEAAFRDSLDDGDFWNYVLLGLLPGQEQFDDGPWDDGPPEITYAPLNPCRVCGSIDACGYDNEGRALIHATEDDDQ